MTHVFVIFRLHKIGKQNPHLNAENGDEDGHSPDMTAFVSALANQRSEENSIRGSIESLDVANMQYVPKDLHSLSKMFIQVRRSLL